MERQFPAVRVKADELGFSPKLKVGEYCQDHAGLWHFCAPDGGRFCVDPAGYMLTANKRMERVVDSPRGITILPDSPNFCWLADAVDSNVWTVHDDGWYKK
jgi:hypothetical protein